MILYQTFMVLLIFCFKTGLGLEEYGCMFDKDYNMRQTNSEKKIMYPVWGLENKIVPYYMAEQLYGNFSKKIEDAKKTIVDQYIYDGTEVTKLFSEYKETMLQENKPLNKADWEQFLADRSSKIDSRQDTLGLIKKIFNKLFDSLKEDKNFDLGSVKKACYFAAVETEVEGEIYKRSSTPNTGFYDSMGVIDISDGGLKVIHIFIHPFFDGLPLLPTIFKAPRFYYTQRISFLKNEGRLSGENENIMDVEFNSEQPDLKVHLKNPLCSVKNNANLKMKNDPLIIFGKLTFENGFSSYIMTSVDGTGRSGSYCKELSKEKNICIGYSDGTTLVERTFGSVNKMTPVEKEVLKEVAKRMNNEVHPVTYEYLWSKLKEMDAFVTDYDLSTEGSLAQYSNIQYPNYGCTFDMDYNVHRTNSEKKIMYPVWGLGNKIVPFFVDRRKYDTFLKKIEDAKKRIVDKYIYDGTEVTKLFSEYSKTMLQENKADWEQFLTDRSSEIDSRQDSLGIMTKIFNELFRSLKEDKNIDLKDLKKACYFAAVKTKVEGEIFDISVPINTGFYDSIGVIEIKHGELNHVHIFIHPFFDGLPLLESKIGGGHFEERISFLKNTGSLSCENEDIMDVFFDNSTQLTQTDLEVYLKNPLCSIKNNANLKMKNDPLIIFGKLTFEDGFSSYIMTSVDGTGPSGRYCKNISKEKKFCIGYSNGQNLVERTFDSVNQMTEDDKQVLQVVAERMNNTSPPVTYEDLLSKLSELDVFVQNYKKNSRY